VNYHAVSAAFSTFFRHYSRDRQVVREQLQTMADDGADVIKTAVWMGRLAPSPPASWDDYALSFPLQSDELQAVATYVQDVAEIQSRDGHELELDLSVHWDGCSQYEKDSTAATAGPCGLPWADFMARAHESVTGLMRTIAPIRRSDGRPAVALVYFISEASGDQAKPNEGRVVRELYPEFLQMAAAAGIVGSMYFIVDGQEAHALDNTYVNRSTPILSRHRSLISIYQAVQILKDAGIPLPARLDFSLYPEPDRTSVAAVLRRTFDDLATAFPGMPLGVAETRYPLDPGERTSLATAFRDEFARRGSPQRIVFWTTPDGGGSGVDVGYPFDFQTFLGGH